MTKIYLTTDTHLYHDQLIEWSERPENHTKLILDNWRKTVTKNDLTIHLGDVTWDTKTLKAELDSIPGRKILIMGNHDEKPAEWYMKNGFDFACSDLSMAYKGHQLFFQHEPPKIATVAMDQFPPTTRFICGHLHNNDHRAHGYELCPLHRLLAIEDHALPGAVSEAIFLAYKPISLDKVIR